VLKVTEAIWLGHKDGQVTVLLLLDFLQAFDMVVHVLLLCKAEKCPELFGWCRYTEKSNHFVEVFHQNFADNVLIIFK
jgi:hypothetical protein